MDEPSHPLVSSGSRWMMERKKAAKVVNQSAKGKKVYFTYMDFLKSGLTPAQIARKEGVSKQYVSKVLRPLKACGAVSRVGYGVWKVEPEKYEAALKVVNLNASVGGKAKGSVRGHGFRFLVRTRLMDWGRLVSGRRCPMGGFLVEVLGHKLKLFRRSFEVYFRKGWSAFGPDSLVTFRAALAELGKVVGKLERLYGVDLGRPLKLRVSRQHYALVRNELAKEYNLKKEKLRVLAEDGKTWLLIDNSYQLEELETQHRETARRDNEYVRQVFNEIRDGANFTDVYNGIGEVSKGVTELNEKLKPLIDSLKPPKPSKKPDYFG